MMKVTAGMKVNVVSKMKFEIQYEVRLTPEIIYICFSCSSRSLIIVETRTDGIKASAIPMITANETDCCDSYNCFVLYITGNGLDLTLNCRSTFGTAVLRIDW